MSRGTGCGGDPRRGTCWLQRVRLSSKPALREKDAAAWLKGPGSVELSRGEGREGQGLQAGAKAATKVERWECGRRNKLGLTGPRAVARSCDLEVQANRLAVEEVRSYLQALRQMRGVCPSCLCDCSLFWSKGLLEGRQRFLKACPLPQPRILQATEAAM